MESSQRKFDPALEKWLREVLGANRYAEIGDQPLLAMILLVERGEADHIPDDVLSAWRRMIVAARREADQSEDTFIGAARRQGMTWQHIADVLGLPSAQIAEGRQAVLEEELRRNHPGNNPTPWLP